MLEANESRSTNLKALKIAALSYNHTGVEVTPVEAYVLPWQGAMTHHLWKDYQYQRKTKSLQKNSPENSLERHEATCHTLQRIIILAVGFYQLVVAVNLSTK